MNYGYEPTKDDESLALRIETEVLAKLPKDDRGMKPYIEINQSYPGVRIRRITHYSDTVIDEMVRACDKIHAEIIA